MRSRTTTRTELDRKHHVFVWSVAWLLAAAALSTPAAAGDLPDPVLTPGTVLTTDAAAVCTPGYAKSVRHVSGKVKAAVYREYGIAHHASGEYEVDHLISLELGGSNDIRNLCRRATVQSPGTGNRGLSRDLP
ncbi:MAG: hypothetical protein QOK29_653 [Rhodospirillaceae bacterium]|nr:hypothetical protein [Rhodospirillaceae bacterium]